MTGNASDTLKRARQTAVPNTLKRGHQTAAFGVHASACFVMPDEALL
jgi:hypothetical protein